MADGGTDRLLVPIIQWAIHRLDPVVEILEPEFRKRHGSVVDFLGAYESRVMLFDGAAVAKAAGSPASRVPVPAVGDIEGISNPKERLDDLLFRAAGSPTGRRGRNFKRSIVDRRVSVAEYISDYDPLRRLPAFRRFQESLAEQYPYTGLPGR